VEADRRTCLCSSLPCTNARRDGPVRGEIGKSRSDQKGQEETVRGLDAASVEEGKGLTCH